MRLVPVASHVVRWLRRVMFERAKLRIGGTDVADARVLADVERAAGGEPEGCAWLDPRTIEDLDLPLTFRAIDRTASPTGAQALWRWLTAPAIDGSVLRGRERKLAHLADPELRARISTALSGTAAVDAPFLPRLLWEPPPPRPRATVPIAIALTLLACIALAWWWPPLILCALAIGIAAMLLDSWLHHQLAEQAHALAVLGDTLDKAARVAAMPIVPEALLGTIADDLAIRQVLRRRLLLLAARDPFEILEVLRAALLIRLFVLRSCMRIVDAERERLRRIVLWLGELDALVSIARLRDERPDVRVPDLVDNPDRIDSSGIVHPILEHGVGNDVVLAPGLLVTGSNMSGKSTLLRTVAVNAILAQSIHSTFGAWRAPLVTVHAVMRIRDDLGAGMSQYAVEVAAIGELVAAAGQRTRVPKLFVLDEPFHGTNPAIRVPIVVAVFEHLAAHGLIIGATHDLDVATLLGSDFGRGYFAEHPAGGFDRTLRSGVAQSTNAVELLARAGYPSELLARVERCRARPGREPRGVVRAPRT
jgi:hypothetical protein